LNTASCRLESARPDAVVIYATIPTTAVVEFFTVESVERLPLGPLWRRIRDVAGVARAEYLAYFDGLVEGVAIFVSKAQRLSQPLPLRELRAVWPGFHPPQDLRYLDAGAIDGMCSLIVELRRAA
jgi:predicted transcriptional regulator